MDALDILKIARKKIADPKAWGKGSRAFCPRPRNTYCAAEAIEEQSHNFDDEYHRAMRALRNAAGVDRNIGLPDWNDAPERTHAEVIAAFDLAIATLRLS